MPLYEIEHRDPAHPPPPQKADLARSLTQIHSHLFATPSLFVNVRFTDTAGQDVYVGGKTGTARACGKKAPSPFLSPPCP